jgi:proteasome accessory factor C
VGDGRTARARLERLLHVLPAASRDGGAALSELAATLATSEHRILEDLEEVTARAYYHPGGWPDDVQILVQHDRVRVLHSGGIDRPVKLSPRETLCLALALRGTAASAALESEQEREALLRRAEAHLAALPSDTLDIALAAPERLPDPEGIRELLVSAAAARRACAIHYVKPGAADGSVRVVHPYGMAYAEGHWYAVGHCTVEDGLRIFRLDRILAADVTEDGFEPSAGFRLEELVRNGRLFHAEDERPLRVRYSPSIARWIRERAAWESVDLEELEDGSVVLRHRLADPWWAVSQALQYGAEAEILEPHDVRALVAQVAQELAAGAA